jgi:hypothetical protein
LLAVTAWRAVICRAARALQPTPVKVAGLTLNWSVVLGGIMRQYIGTLLIGLTLAGSASACVGSVRVYDESRRDYHRWNGDEERFYRVYLSERRRPYIEFRRLNQREQEDYWEWRHSRERDRDRDRDRDRR